MKKFIIALAAAAIFLPGAAYADSEKNNVQVKTVDGIVQVALMGDPIAWEAYCLRGGMDTCLRNCNSTYSEMKFACEHMPGDIYGEQVFQCLDYTESEYASCKEGCTAPCTSEA